MEKMTNNLLLPTKPDTNTRTQAHTYTHIKAYSETYTENKSINL